MSNSTTFVSKQTTVSTGWANDVNTAVFTALGDGSSNPPTTPAQVRANIAAVGTADLASTADGKGVSLVGGANRVVASIAALKALSKLTNSNVFVTGYYVHGDGGGGQYWYDSSDTTSTDNGGTIIVASDGGRWKLVVTGPISLRQFGAKGDNTTDDSAAIQACVTWAAGHQIYAPVGQYKLTTGITSTGPINLSGDGNGCGPGPGAISNTNCTQFMLYSSTAVAFTSTSNYPSTFSGFQINCAVANRPMSAGGGILISGPIGSTNAGSKIVNVGFSNVYIPITLTRTLMPVVSGCYFDSWVFAAVYANTTSGVEGGLGDITGNDFFGTSGSTSQNGCIISEVGYGHVHHNLIIGANYGVQFVPKNNAAGALRIDHNFIENQGSAGVYALTQDGSNASMLGILDNEFSNISYTTNWVASVVVVDYSSGTDWITDIQVKGNVHRHSLTTSRRYVWIQSGKNIQVINEQMENLGAGATTYGVDISTFTGAALKAPSIISGCQFTGTFAANYLVTAVTQLIDNQGIAFANLPAAVANGSQVYCPDGTFANPVAGSGTGCIAKRLNGAWRGD